LLLLFSFSFYMSGVFSIKIVFNSKKKKYEKNYYN
jgi:hypothetical protein